jgi:hypothetical protein
LSTTNFDFIFASHSARFLPSYFFQICLPLSDSGCNP